MSGRSTTTMWWAAGIGILGSVALVCLALATTVAMALAGGFAEIFLQTWDQSSGGQESDIHAWAATDDLVVVTAVAIALCLGTSFGGGWVLAGAPEGLTPRWLAGAAAGLLGVAAGFAVFGLASGWSPI